MLIHSKSTPVFLLNIYIHIVFSLLVLVVLFFTVDTKYYKKDIGEKMQDVIEKSDIFTKLKSINKPQDLVQLKTLETIYKNESLFEKEVSVSLERSTIFQLFILVVSLIIILFIMNRKLYFYKEIFKESIIYFGCIGCLFYIFHYFIEREYVDIFSEDIEKIMISEMKKLRKSTEIE
jgi:hypothetical protein